jgi:RNA polymerase subunit RPABC4/transcription elongation factor Spt4
VKKTLAVILLATLIFLPTFAVFAVETPSQPETVPVGEPKPAEEQGTDILSSFGNFMDTFQSLVPFVLIAIVLIIALWVFFDASRRTNFGWVWGLASLLIVPWIIYLVWRPSFTVEERNVLEADMSLRRIEKEYYQYMLSKEKFICTVCGTPTHPDYQVCPSCFKELKKVCASCGRLLDLGWKICPYCATRISDKKGE